MKPVQLSIFSHPGLYSVVRDVKESLQTAVHESRQSREHVLAPLTELAKRYGMAVQSRSGVSKDLLEKGLNPEDDCRVPTLKSLALLCAALETTAPIAALAASVGGRVIDGEDVKLLEWAKAYHATRALKKRMRRIEEELG